MTRVVMFLAMVAAERPQMEWGRLSVLGPASNLASEIESLGRRERGTLWAGYAVPMVAGSHHLCGGDDVVHLEDSDRGYHSERGDGPTRSLFVLHRIQNGRITKIRLLSSSCRIDAGSSVVYWWEPVPPGASLDHLTALTAGADEDLAEDAVHAAALHGDPGADELLGELVSSARSFEVRERAVFWLGAVRGDEGFRRLARGFERERDEELREEMVFAIHLSKAEGAIPKLVDIAKKDFEPDVREKALFWLAERAGKVASRAIASSVKDDPELDVKKQAVFALSQLPEEEGVPLLMEVAETHPHPEVRERAFVWLGQSGDPRALEL
ncbi:MAG: HEAT repeat domain-containing protein, partial [Vicinamibacteria bacterium]